MLTPKILDKIIVYTNPGFQKFYNQELFPGFFQAVTLGRSKAVNEHNRKKLIELLSEKYLNVEVVAVSVSPNETKITLLNGRHGVDNGVDEGNEPPIEFLKSFGANVSKEKAEDPNCSYSVITFDKSKLDNIIKGLEVMPTPNLEGNMGKIMAKC
jgi:hypothetical protein